MDDTLGDLFKHNLWANLRLLDFCAKLDGPQLDASIPGTYGRVRDTLLHILTAEQYYVIVLTGDQLKQPLRSSDGFPGFEELRRSACHTGEELARLAAQIQPTQVLQSMNRGKPYATQARIVLVQAINHATEHRAHVVTTLSQLGIKSPTIDGWVYGLKLGISELDHRT